MVLSLCRPIKVLCLTLLFPAMFNATVARAEKVHLIPSIDAVRTDSGVLVQGRVHALGQGNFETSMTIARRGVSGKTTTRQNGRWTAASDESIDVGHVVISFSEGDHLNVDLTVRADGREVASTSFQLGN